GRLTLLKSVLGASPIYNLSIYKAPITVLKEMERIRSNFFKGADNNDRKISWVSWDKVLESKKVGALHGTSLESHQVQITSLWSSILREMHVLVLKGFDLMAHCKKRIGDENNTSFWRDPWIGDQPLRLMFLRLFVLDKEKEITVASKLGLPSVDSSFHRQSWDGIERQQWMDLISWWELDSQDLSSFADWDVRFSSIRRLSKSKVLLEGVFFVVW
nr:hypothetical protein [Tanacetum cinerariifolium]